MNMMLVGDVGGTKTLLEVGSMLGGRWQPALGARYVASRYPNLQSVIQHFLRECEEKKISRHMLTRACIGVAGPMYDNRVQMTNLPWTVDGHAIGAEFKIPCVEVVNDFFAAASGVEMLENADLVALQAGEPVSGAPRLVIGAGTGLGIAHLIREASGYRVVAGEGGHAAFAPATLEQAELWRGLFMQHGRVTAEDVVSGAGLVRVYEFIDGAVSGRKMPADITPAAITQAALDSFDPISLRALDLFIECFGEVAGNCALALLARGGVFIAGGIAPKIISRLRAGGFLVAFNAKGAQSDAVRKFPVSVVSNERLGLLGCALIATRLQGV